MTDRRITLEELSKLTGRQKAAVAYGGYVYDVTEFLDKHPGGSLQLLMAAGRDVTQFFNSYHSIAIRKLIAKKCKCIGVLDDSSNSNSASLPIIKFPEKDEFYEEMKNRVRKYFKDRNLDPKVNSVFFQKGACVFVTTLLFWYMAIRLTSLGYSLFIGSTFALLYGFSAALLVMNLGHDASHYAVTHSPWVWQWLAHFLSCVHGLSPHVWIYQHVIGHHVHPNHDAMDPDVTTKDPDFWRIKPFQKRCSHYIFQHLYIPILFCLLSIKMKIQDFHSFFVGKKAEITINPPCRIEVLALLLSKAVHVYYRFILPYPYIPFGHLLLLNLLSELVMGYWLGFITQLNHVNSSVVFPEPYTESKMTWSEMQLATTADYATESNLWAFLTGGLNNQAIHHLFPSVLSSYYKALTPILRDTCAEYGKQYNVYNNIWEMFLSHFKYLQTMGQSSVKEN